MAQDVERVMRLSELGLSARLGKNPSISGLSLASNQVQEGHLFAAFSGAQTHGAQYAQDAIERGAIAVMTDVEGARIFKSLENVDIALVVVEDPRQAFARACTLWFEHQPEVLVAVTGTNGKTSVASFTRQIWQLLGLQAVNLGTTGVEGAWSFPLSHTTPDALTLHFVLNEAVKAGVSHVAMEASSHGLDQKRLDGVMMNAAGFTNFTQDHLDYHETFEAYFEAKSGLFSRVLCEGGVAVVNFDDPMGAEITKIAQDGGHDVLGVGAGLDARLRLLAQRCDETGQNIRFSYDGVSYQKRLPLVGGFQAQNVLLAAGLVVASGQPASAVFETFPHLETVTGRMQHVVSRANGAPVFVDYAHTPDAVQTALGALRPHILGRVIAIVGAGGDRDRSKRPLMGAAAAREADVVIVSDDNPRSEDPKAIRLEVLEGAQREVLSQGDCPTVLYNVGDRAEAILRAVDMLEAGDALLIAGKGHEKGQIVGDQLFPFDDAEQASLAVCALEGRV